MFQTVSTREFTSRRRPATQITAAGGSTGEQGGARRPALPHASTNRCRSAQGKGAAATDASAAGSSRSRSKWAQSSRVSAASAAESAALAELAATPGLLEPMRVEMTAETEQDNRFRVSAAMKSRHHPNVIYHLLRDFKSGPAVFGHMEKCTAEPRADGTFLVVQHMKWKFQMFSGKFALALICSCDDAARTITYQLAYPGFMKAFVGTSTIRGLSPLPHKKPTHSPLSSSSSLPLTVPGARVVTRTQPLLQPPPVPVRPLQPLQPRSLQQRLLQLQQGLPLTHLPAQLLAFGRVAVGEPQIRGDTLGRGGGGGLGMLGGVLGRGGLGMQGVAVGGGGSNIDRGAVGSFRAAQKAIGGSGPSDCGGSTIEIVQSVEPANLPLGPFSQYIMSNIISSQMRGLFHDLCVEATNIEERSKAEAARQNAAVSAAAVAPATAV